MTVARWRIIILIVLFLAPFLGLLGYGAYRLWSDGLMFWYTWPMLICVGLSVFLAWRWQATQKLLRVNLEDVPMHWT
ncbi:MAG: hypothetical protein ABR611_16135, partial [Chthoniobacterales bacterium]